MKVEVRPIPVEKWHGKKGKESFGRPKDIEVLYDSTTGRYATGLTPEEATLYSQKMGVALDDTFNPNEAHPYWSTKAATIRLPNHTVYFNTDIPAEFVKVKNLKASKYVANSLKEFEENKWPDALFIIYDEEEEMNVQAGKIALTDECTLLKSKMSDEDKASMIQILSNKTVKGRSTNFLNVELNAIIEEKPADFLRFAKMGREEVYVRSSVLECIHKGILTQDAGSVYYMGEMIGFDIEATIQWFKEPTNSKMKVAIFEKLTK